MLDMISPFLLDDGSADMRAIHRFAVEQRTAARRQRRARAARDWGRLVMKALRALRFAARVKAGRLHGHPHSSHSLFSETPKEVSDPVVPGLAPNSDRRRTFRERRRRR
jgi:hypothetical protein